MDTISSVRPQTSTGSVNNIVSNKSINYSPPASPASSISGDISPAPASPASAAVSAVVAALSAAIANVNVTSNSSPVSGVAPPTTSNGIGNSHNHNLNSNSAPTPTVGFSHDLHSLAQYASLPNNNNSTSRSSHNAQNNLLCTPKKLLADADMLQRIREKLRTPGGAYELQTLQQLEHTDGEQRMKVIKERYLISTHTCQITPAIAAKTPASYRHLIDLTASSLRCTDVYTEQEYLCKIINEPLRKVQNAYFQLKQEGDNGRSSLYGHVLIRGVHDIVPLSKQRTYLIIAPPQEHEGAAGVYEDLHTYIRNKRRLCEAEARALFHQICEAVSVCHRNGIILRDLKLKRFYFIDEARTKLQYESLEGSMILDDPQDDTLSDKIGCPLYTAPELLCPNPTYRGKPADMWSLGVILYTMLVGQYPFYEKGNCNLITIIRHCHVQIPMTLSRSVRWLLLLLLRKNYEERMQVNHVFLSPWLKEQRPYYMYVPVDVSFSDDDDEEVQEQQQQDAHSMAHCDEDFPSGVPSSTPMEDCDVDCDINVEPLDYSRRALQPEAHHSNTHVTSNNADGDVEMG